MTTDQAVALVTHLLRTTLFVVGPLLGAALVAGVFVGIMQTATQVNEASISFLVKVAAVVVLGAALGSQLATYVLDYTKQSFEAIAEVVH